MRLFCPRCRIRTLSLAEQIVRAFALAAICEVPICPFIWLNGSLDVQRVACSSWFPGKVISGTVTVRQAFKWHLMSGMNGS